MSRLSLLRGTWLVLASALAAGLSIAAGAAPPEKPRYGGTAVTVLGADPAVLNPGISVGVPDVFTGCILYDALVRFGKNFEIVPNLAKSWEIAPDGLTYTFHLEKAAFTDGKPVTSEDVKFSLTQVSAKYGPKFNAPGSFIQAIETPDPLTAIIKLSKPFGPFLFSLACEQNAPILPAHVFQGSDVLKNEASLSKPVGNGPFMLQEWVRGDHLTFVKNPNYWRKGQPYLDKIVVKIMPDSSARVLALRAGEVDFIDEYYFPLSAHAQFARDPNYVLQDVSYPSDDVAIINTKKPHLDNAKVRQALLIAIDREFLHRAVFYGIGGVPRARSTPGSPGPTTRRSTTARCTRTTRSGRPRFSTRPTPRSGPMEAGSRSGSPSMPGGRNTRAWPRPCSATGRRSASRSCSRARNARSS